MLDVLTHVVKIMECDKDRCRLAMTCMKLIKSEFYFNNLINIKKINNLQWFDKFTNIRVVNFKKLPQSITHLTFEKNFDTSLKGRIPLTVKSVTFFWDLDYVSVSSLGTLAELYFKITHFQESVNDYFPLSVKEIIFHGDFSYNQQLNLQLALNRDDLKITFINPPRTEMSF